MRGKGGEERKGVEDKRQSGDKIERRRGEELLMSISTI